MAGSNQSGGIIIACYNSGTVTGMDFPGGVVAMNNGDITACYNSGAVTGNGSSDIGGVVGTNRVTVTDCWWESTTASSAIGYDYNGTVVGCGNCTVSSSGLSPLPSTLGYAEWGTGNGQSPNTYWKNLTGTAANGYLPQLWFE